MEQPGEQHDSEGSPAGVHVNLIEEPVRIEAAALHTNLLPRRMEIVQRTLRVSLPRVAGDPLHTQRAFSAYHENAGAAIDFKMRSPLSLPLNQGTKRRDIRYTEQDRFDLFMAQIRWQGRTGAEPIPFSLLSHLQKSVKLRGAGKYARPTERVKHWSWG